MKTFVKRKKMSSDMALQITSMADIFMILLVFLLKNYSQTLTSLAPVTRAKLPIAMTSTSPKDSLKIEIGETALLVDGKPILELRNYETIPGELPEHGHSGALYKVLMSQRKKNYDSNVLLFADEKVPYATIKRVLASAASSGFVDLQLVVVSGE